MIGPVEVLYFADSMGSMKPEDAASIVSWIREKWAGPVGIHTHDNMGLALHNTISAQNAGATWFDATVTGMGRGPGNARTEEVVIELPSSDGEQRNLVPLLSLIRQHFGPMKAHYGWGTNPYYFLAGKYGIHPTYIQSMLGDDRYDEEDILGVIDHLHEAGGASFRSDLMNDARNYYKKDADGSWAPRSILKGRDVLVLGTGPGVKRHKEALENFVHSQQPVVIALNTQSALSPESINYRIACQPIRLMADVEAHKAFPQPLITPASMLPPKLAQVLSDKELLDFGLSISNGGFSFGDTHCAVPSSIVLAYALAVAASGQSRNIYMAGFDGYPAGDLRNDELENLLEEFQSIDEAPDCISITPTIYKSIHVTSVYGF